ncbi:Ig-like domain-containing protein, partial [Eubacterium sp. MSJ-13]|uniref:Ig-like domain-containing protein n=1 Tax=Eubacterium sp. MSJ-13 TaxID=2841513 RepID=UPI001C1072F9
VQPTTEPTAEPSVQPTTEPTTKPSKKPGVKDQSKLSPSEVVKLKLPVFLAMGKDGNHKVKISWAKYAGATGYDCYWSYCNGKKKFEKFAKITNGKRSVMQKNLKNNQCYKYYIVAYKLVDGKKVYIAKSNQLHVAMKKNNRTNAVSISVNKNKLSIKSGQTFTIKAKTKLENSKKKQLIHAKVYRYYSSDKKVAVVSKSGKITAKSKGKCTIAVVANNGVCKKITVKVK